MENKYPIIIAAVILFFFLVYKEVTRANKQRLAFRLLAVLSAVLALVFLILPIKYKTSSSAKTGELHLLSPGVTTSSLKNLVYYTTDSSILLNRGGKNVSYLPDLEYYLQSHPEISRIQVYGYGLPQVLLNRLKDYSFSFEPAAIPSGIISCSWPAKLKQTEILQVQGVYNNTSDQPVKLILNGLGSKCDSILIGSNKKMNFSLQDRPRHLGRAVYALTALQAADTIVQQKIAFQIVETQKIKLLVLSSFPDFEYKFLKNWLYENKYQVVFRTRISKDQFSVDQLNTAAINVDELQAGTLSKFDVVIADDEELSKVSPGGLNNLETAISNGLGLLLRISDEQTASVFGKQLKLYTTADSAVKSLTPVFTEETKRLQALPLSQSLYMQPRSYERILVKHQSGKTLVSSLLSGNGKITSSLIASTYPWILSGKPLDYASFWSRLISYTSRKQEDQNVWKTIPAQPVTGQQTQLIYQAAQMGTLPALQVGKVKLDLTRNKVLPNTVEATFWPQVAGWNELKLAQKTAEYFFVYKKTDWSACNNYQTLLETTAFTAKHLKNNENSTLQPEILEKEISIWWFFALFLMSVAYIWFETKLL